MVLFQIYDTTVLRTHPCFQVMLSNDYAVPESFLTLPHGWPHWGWVRSCEGTQPGQLISNDWRDIPLHLASCYSVKSWGKKKERRTFGLRAFVFPTNCYEWWILFFLEIEKDLQLVVDEFLILLCLCAQLFLYLLNCLYLDTSFLALLPFWFSAHSTRLGGAGDWGSKQ